MVTEKNTLGGPAGSEDVRPQMSARDFVVGDGLKRRPPLRVQKRLVREPIRNQLLRARAALHEFGELLSEGALAPAGDIDGPPEGGNVLLFRRHSPSFYTNQFVAVNNPVCVTDDKRTCSVVSMDHARAKRQEKRAPKPSSKRIAVPGPDGKTLGQRVAEAMAYKTGRQSGTQYQQIDLIRDVARYLQIPATDTKLQQRISAITTNKVSESALSPAIAAATGVNSLWLAYGWGKMTG